MSFIPVISTFILSTGYVLLLDYFTTSPRSLQKALVLPIVLLLIGAYWLSKISWKEFLASPEKWIFLFWTAVLVPMLIIATGNLHSPFLILLHLFMIGLSLFFSFLLALAFLGLSFITIFADISFHADFMTIFLQDPGAIILPLLSLISIIPIAYIVSYKYRLKDWLFTKLQTQVVTDEAILESLQELIIVTDPKLHIISVNDAVERALLRSRSEILYKQIFNVFLLKDKNNKLVTKETFFLHGSMALRPKKIADTFMLIATKLQNVTVQVQKIKDLEKNIVQISFIINPVQSLFFTDRTSTTVEKARVKYEALVENLKKQIMKTEFSEIRTQMFLMERVADDIYNAQLLKNMQTNNTNSRIDLAKLCKHLVRIQEDFAKAFHVNITFTLHKFGYKDIAPLIVKNFHVKPEEFTGPFFTVACDVKQIELLVKKLLDMSVLLASTEKNAQVVVSIERGKQNTIIIKIISSCPVLSKETLSNLLVPYYGNLYNKTNLYLGSGLEGFIIKKISDTLPLALDTQYKNGHEPMLIFTLPIKKNFSL